MNGSTKPTVTTDRGERKQITAVFIDVVGFSDIASVADAEDLQAWLEEYYDQSREIIEAHDGEVTEYLGDGVVALFGLARADELSAAKAVNAAIKAVNEISASYKGEVSMQLRAGVATGEVAVRAMSDNDGLPRATGMVTTLARRIQESAKPGNVMVSESTKMLLRGSIALKKVPDQQLKGFADPQTLFQPSPSVNPTENRKLPFFVGRESELSRIAANTQPSLIIGQAGIGKTALSQFVAQSMPQGTTFSADGVHTRASYQPFSDWIVRQVGTPLPEFSDIQKHFGDLDINARRALALVLGLDEGQLLLAQTTNVALKGLIEGSLWQAIRNKQADGLLIFEDLHWLDNASFGVLVGILENPESADYRILMTSREDTKIGEYLGALPVDMIPLEALNKSEASVMLNALGAVDAAEHDRLIDKAAGVPLFIEQLFKRSVTSGNTDQVPGSLMDLLTEQIDATGSSKPVLQCASILGRSFTLKMLQAIASDHHPLEGHLSRACGHGVLKQDNATRWSFSHALLHQAAYQGMLRKTRIEYHAQVADHLQAQHADAVRRNPALLTDHLSLAHKHVPAIQNYLTVSQWAMFQGAFADAEAHIRAAISLCAEAPADVDVSDLEIACYTALGSIQMQTQGFMAPPVKEAFETVEKLASVQHRYSAANGPAFYGSFSHAIILADKPAAERFCDLLSDTADYVADEPVGEALRLASLNAKACLSFYSGNFQQQFSEFSELRSIYDVKKHGAMIANYGMDTFAAAQMFEPVGRAITGQTHQVAALSAETDAHQKLLNIPVMQPYALVWGAVPLFYAGETEAALERLHRGLTAANEQSAAFWQVTGAVWLHIIDPTQNETPEGLAAFDQIIKTHEMIGANVGLPYFRACYAAENARFGHHDLAYQSSLLAVRECEKLDLHCWYAEIMRLHAQVCNQLRRSNEAAQYLTRALDVANAQGAALWRIRILLDQHAMHENQQDAIASALDAFSTNVAIPETEQARTVLNTL